MTLVETQQPELEQIYQAHFQAVFRLCLRFAAQDREWALDRTQEVFVKLLEHLNEVAQLHNPSGWLYRVAVNACYQALRRERIWSRLAKTLSWMEPLRPPPPMAVVEANRDAVTLRRLLGQMAPKSRMIIVLLYLEEKSQVEVSQLLGLSKGQVSKLHQRALAYLREHGWELRDA